MPQNTNSDVSCNFLSIFKSKLKTFLKDLSKCGLNLDTLFGVEVLVESYTYTPIPHP